MALSDVPVIVLHAADSDSQQQQQQQQPHEHDRAEIDDTKYNNPSSSSSSPVYKVNRCRSCIGNIMPHQPTASRDNDDDDDENQNASSPAKQQNFLLDSSSSKQHFSTIQFPSLTCSRLFRHRKSEPTILTYAAALAQSAISPYEAPDWLMHKHRKQLLQQRRSCGGPMNASSSTPSPSLLSPSISTPSIPTALSSSCCSSSKSSKSNSISSYPPAAEQRNIIGAAAAPVYSSVPVEKSHDAERTTRTTRTPTNIDAVELVDARVHTGATSNISSSMSESTTAAAVPITSGSSSNVSDKNFLSRVVVAAKNNDDDEDIFAADVVVADKKSSKKPGGISAYERSISTTSNISYSSVFDAVMPPTSLREQQSNSSFDAVDTARRRGRRHTVADTTAAAASSSSSSHTVNSSFLQPDDYADTSASNVLKIQNFCHEFAETCAVNTTPGETDITRRQQQQQQRQSGMPSTLPPLLLPLTLKPSSSSSLKRSMSNRAKQPLEARKSADTIISLTQSSPSKTPTKARRTWRKVFLAIRLHNNFCRAHFTAPVAGHRDSVRAGAEPGTLLKRYDDNEWSCLKQLMSDTMLRPFVPQLLGLQRTTIPPHLAAAKDAAAAGDAAAVAAGKPDVFIKMADLLFEFETPCVMDCKIGVRTYLESELEKARKKPVPRADMYQKMIAVDVNAPTDDEHAAQSVVKARYMLWREKISSTHTLGFRVEGMLLPGSSSDTSSSSQQPPRDFKKIQQREQVKKAFDTFIRSSYMPPLAASTSQNKTKKAAANSSSEHEAANMMLNSDYSYIVGKYLTRLKQLRAALELSPFFASREMIGSSLLFVHDHSQASVWMIDFVNSVALPPGVTITHRKAWNEGNHEDGYLTGLDNIIAIFVELHEQYKPLAASAAGSASSSVRRSAAAQQHQQQQQQQQQSDDTFSSSSSSPTPAVSLPSSPQQRT